MTWGMLLALALVLSTCSRDGSTLQNSEAKSNADSIKPFLAFLIVPSPLRAAATRDAVASATKANGSGSLTLTWSVIPPAGEPRPVSHQARGCVFACTALTFFVAT